MRTDSDARPDETGPTTFDERPVSIDGRLTRFLLRVAGVDVRDLHDSPAEVARYSVYGFAVIVTSALALFTMPIALSIALGGFRWLMVPVGVIWAAFIFNIDRWIITVIDHKSLNSEDRASVGEWMVFLARKLGLLIVRLALAGVIALSISEPLLLVVFSHEVESAIKTIHQDEIRQAHRDIDKDVKGDYQAERDRLQSNVDAALTAQLQKQTAAAERNNDLNTALGRLNCEVHPDTADCPPELSEGSTGKPGCVGKPCTDLQDALTAARTVKKQADEALLRANKAVTDAQDNLLIKLGVKAKPKGSSVLTIDEEKARDKKIAEANLPSTEGFSVHEQALSHVAHHDATAGASIWLVRALLLMFELTPILLKTFSPPTVYEKRARLRAVRAVAAGRKAFQAHLAADAEVLGERVDVRADREIRTLDAADAAHELETDLGSELEKERLRREHDIALRLIVADHARRAAQIDSVDIGMFEQNPDEPDDEAQEPGEDGMQPPDGAAEPSDEPGQPADPDLSETPVQPAPAPPAPSPSATEGLIDGRWRLVKYLASANEGGMAIAIMVVTDASNELPGYLVYKRFKTGHDLNVPTGRLSDHIAPVLAKGPVDDCFYVVTPFYAAGSLAARLLQTPPLALGTAIQYVRETLRGLSDVWDKPDGSGERYQLLHLDIKPANLVFDDSGQIQIIDWGLSSFESEKRHVPTTSWRMGTLWYAPPEQLLCGLPGWPARGWRSPWADIRSVGAVFYEMFTGYRPLWHQAIWGGAIQPNGLPHTEGPIAYLPYLSLLAGEETFPMLDYAGHLTANQRRALEPLQETIGTWLKPDRTQRTQGEPAEPTIALEMLRQASSHIAEAGLVELPIGQYGGMRSPARRTIKIRPVLDIQGRDDPDGVA